jgi:hypothetical protein
MQISFFEEFPSKDNLAKIKYITFPTKLYIGANSLEQFEKITVGSKHVKEKIYWPILKKEEGYWFSPFSNRAALVKTLKELERSNVSIMWDAELPTHQNPKLYLAEMFNFLGNRKKIRSFIAKNKSDIYTAEYFPSSLLAQKFFEFVGVSFVPGNHYPIKMIYSSMHDFGEFLIRQQIQTAKDRYGDKLCIGLGTLTHGILGTEPVISVELLERDLNICKELGIKEVILFRLGGMNKEYTKLLEKFVN